MSRVAFIGLDGVERDFAAELMDRGEMPHLARLRAASARCSLRSEPSWRTGRVWESFLTGRSDGASAILFDPSTYDTWQLGARTRPPFYAHHAGLRVLALDVPYMSLGHDVEGAQVVWGGHDTGYPRASRPAGLLPQIDAEIGTHPAFHNDFTCGWFHPESIEELCRALDVGARRRVDAIRWLQRRHPDWDLLLTVLSEAHSAGEFLWHGVAPDHPLAGAHTAALARQRLTAVYRLVDESVGRLVRGLPEDAVVVVGSVHGMGPNETDVPSMVLLPELLHRAQLGAARLVSPGAAAWRLRGRPPVTPRPFAQKWEAWVRRRFDAGARRRVALAWRESFPGRAGEGRGARIAALSVPIPPASPLSPEEVGVPRAPLDWQVPCWYRDQWPRMRAFALPTFYDARVRVNLRGRERHGIVELRDYAATLDQVEELLGACRDPRGGGGVVAEARRPRAADPLDPEGEDADLVILWRPGLDALEHPVHGLVGPFPHRRTGGHTSHGFAFFRGPGIAAGELPERSALDLAPTLSALLGRAEAPGCEGRAIALPRGGRRDARPWKPRQTVGA